jgi:hypothetical protein
MLTERSGRAQIASGSTLNASTIGFIDLTDLEHGRPLIRPPAGLHVPGPLQPLLQQMWRTSPTFRRQCARLAETAVALRVHIGLLPRGTGPVRALSRIEVRDGAVHADVYLESALYRADELLAHEIEHVLEQIDGVNLRALASTGVQGIEPHQEVYETARAFAIGRLVRREVSRGR